jgi:hypothetical protein
MLAKAILCVMSIKSILILAPNGEGKIFALKEEGQGEGWRAENI